MTAQPDQPDLEAGDTQPDVPGNPEGESSTAAEREAMAPDPQSSPNDLQARVEENWDKFMRAAAELENVRKRALREVESARKFGLEKFTNELLAVRDSLEMGLSAGDQSDVKALRDGSEATLKLLATTMERFGVVELDPEGEPFDPELHEAVTMQPAEDAEPGTVLTVFQKGYSLNGRLLRPARVVVAQEAAPKPDES
jgi:molecular chaperone GrpE